MSILPDAAKVENDRIRNRLIEDAEASQSSRALTAAIKVAQSEPGIPIAADGLDADPMKLGVANGVVDLRTDQAFPPRRETIHRRQHRQRLSHTYAIMVRFVPDRRDEVAVSITEANRCDGACRPV